jgi:hypothetical protein
MTFIDGGMFDNEPLGKAIGSAADSDVEADGQPDPNRLFLMIHPNVARSDHREGTGDSPGAGVAYSANPEFGLLAQAERLLNILMTENAVSDWVRANEVNAIVEWRDDFIGMLATIVKQTTVTDTDALIADLDALILRIATVKAQATPGQTAAEYLAEVQSIDRLVAPDPAMGPKRTQIFEKILFILNHVADLQEKRRLWFEVIGHEADLPLAGAQVLGFAGFFEQDWRIYDYRRGRVDAYKALSGWSDAEGKCLVQHAILGVYDREPAEQQPSRGLETPAPDGNNDYLVTLPYWKARTGVPNFPRVSWNDVPKDMQEALLDRVLDRLLQAFDASIIVRALVKSFGKAKLASLLSGS